MAAKDAPPSPESAQKWRIQQLPSFMYKWGGFAIISFIMIMFLHDVISPGIYLDDYAVFKFQEIEGLDGKQMKILLHDEINNIYESVNSLKGTKSDVSPFASTFSIEISGIKSNYNLVIKYIKEKLSLKNGNISINLYKSEDQYCSRIRIQNQLLDKQCWVFADSLSPIKVVDSILTMQAIQITESIDPYIVCLYFKDKRKDYLEAIKKGKIALAGKREVRKYALGTMANLYAELYLETDTSIPDTLKGGYRDSALRYYTRSLSEFPQFYPTKWRYGEFLLETGEFDLAEDLVQEVRDMLTRNDTLFDRLSLRTLIRIYCQTGREALKEATTRIYKAKFGTLKLEEEPPCT